jgi:hypothetical protein
MYSLSDERETKPKMDVNQDEKTPKGRDPDYCDINDSDIDEDEASKKYDHPELGEINITRNQYKRYEALLRYPLGSITSFSFKRSRILSWISEYLTPLQTYALSSPWAKSLAAATLLDTRSKIIHATWERSQSQDIALEVYEGGQFSALR